jgi:hypothetical protein
MLQLLLFTLLFGQANAKSVGNVCKEPVSNTWELYQDGVWRVPHIVRFKNVKYNDAVVAGSAGETPSAVVGLIDVDTPSNKYRPEANKIYKKMVRKYGEPIIVDSSWMWFDDKKRFIGRLSIQQSKNGPAIFTMLCENL